VEREEGKLLAKAGSHVYKMCVIRMKRGPVVLKRGGTQGRCG